MSARRRSKRDVDRFVNQISEKERNGRGYQIALLYHEVGEQNEAKRYISEYLSTRETMPQAHKLMGQIHEACTDYQKAIASYKRCLELDTKQKPLLIKICELYLKVRPEPATLQHWLEKTKAVHPHHPVLMKLEEKILSLAPKDGALEGFYLKQLNRNQGDVSTHIKLLDLYLSSGRVKEAYLHAVDTSRNNNFVSDIKWNEHLIRVFKDYSKKQNVATDTEFFTNILSALCDLIFNQIKNGEIVDCASVLHQLDQTLFEAMLLQSQAKEWTTLLTEMQAQYFFLFGLLIMKRAQKGQLPWKDSSMFALICFLVSNHFTPIETRSSWYAQMKPQKKKVYDRLEKIGCYRLVQGGYVILSLTEGENTSRMQQARQLRTRPVREKLYDIQYTLREMREKKDQSFFLNYDTFLLTPVVPPSRSSLKELEAGVFDLHQDNLHDLVWVAMYRTSSIDAIQPNYPLKASDKIKFTSDDLMTGSPENLCMLDIHAFFYLCVTCASHQHNDQIRNTRKEPYKPYLLPVCLCQPVCSQQQSDWWMAMIKFGNDTTKENFAKTRLTLQKGIETVRLIGSHGVSTANVILLAKTFDERVSDMKAGEFDGNSRCTKLEALELWAAHYWKEATTLLSRMERNQRISMPKERLFPDCQTLSIEPSQVKELLDQAKFALATVAMREHRYEEAKEMFETIKLPWASFYLSQIHRNLADDIDSDSEESSDQRIALVESSLDLLYQTLERIQRDKNHALHRIIPSEIDECVTHLETLRSGGVGASLVESVLYAREGSDRESIYNTPTGRDQQFTANDIEQFPSPTIPEPPMYSTPAVGGRTPSNTSLTQRSGGRVRPSPERLEARIWSLETKLQTTLDLFEGIRDQMKDMTASQREMRKELRESREEARQMKEQIALNARQNSQYLPPQPIPAASYRPHPTQYGMSPSIQSPWAGASLGYPPSSPGPGGGPTRRGMGRAGQMSIPSEVEDDIYAFGEDCYEDDGSQPPPGMYSMPDSQLEQNWPFGHKAGLEGKSTITYSPQAQGNRMPQPGFFANALRGQAIQYAYNQAAAANEQQTQAVLQGQSVYMGQGMGGQPSIAMSLPGPHSSALVQALAAKSPVVTSTMPPNVIAGQPIASKPSALPGMMGASPQGASVNQSAGMPLGMFGQSAPAYGINPSVTTASMPLFDSLVAASKSPEKPLSKPTASPSTTPSFAALAAGSTPTFGSQASAGGSGPTPTFGSIASGSNAAFGTAASGSTPTFGSMSSGSTPAFGGTPSFSGLAAGTSNQPSPLFGSTASHSGSVTSGITSQVSSSPLSGFSGFGMKQNTESAKTSTLTQGTTFSFSQPPPSQSPQKLNQSQSSTPGQSPRKRNDSMEEYEPNVDFKPVLAELPDLVEVKSGEEEEEKLFCQRAKLFRYDMDLKQWKERGIGDMKLLKHNATGKVRILMRREQVLKLCANHVINKEMKLTPMSGSDTAWCWVANDYSEETIKLEQLAVKFKTAEQAQRFKEVFEEAQRNIATDSAPTDNAGKDKTSSTSGKSIAEMFKPKPGQWECTSCLIRNNGDVQKCVACGSLKPGVKAEDVKGSTAPAGPTFTMGGGGFKVGGSTAASSSAGFTFGSNSSSRFTFGSKPTSNTTTSGATSVSGFTAIPASSTTQTTTVTSTTSKSSEPASFSFATGGGGFKVGGSTAASSSAGFTFGSNSGSGFTFGSKPTSQATTSGATSASGFTAVPASSATQTATVTSTTSKSSEPAGSTFAMGGEGFKVGGTTAAPSSAGFSFGSNSGGGFKFGSTATTDASSAGFKFAPSTTAPATQPPSLSASSFKSTPPTMVTTTPSTKSTEFKFGTTQASSNIFSAPKTEASSVTKAPADTTIQEDKSQVPKSQLAELLTSQDSWVCSKCHVARSVKKCPSCGILKPGVKAEDIEFTNTETPKFGLQAFSFKPSTGSGSTFSFATPQKEASGIFGSDKGSLFGTSKPAEVEKVTMQSEKGNIGKEQTGFQFKLDPTSTSKIEDKKETSPFKFSFTPSSGAKTGGSAPFSTTPVSSKSCGAIKSPEVDKDGMYVNKDGEDDHIYFEPIVSLPDKVDIVTGEENENVLFQHRAKLFRFHNKEWKERGLGDIKILENKDSKKIRIVMRREQILKICCNHYLSLDMELKPMSEGKAWLWYAMDFSDDEPKPEQFSVKFRTAEIANNFKEAFDKAKEKLSKTPSTSAKKKEEKVGEAPRKLFEESSASVQKGESTDLLGNDVIFVKEEKATEEQIARARKFQLPDHFYLYESRQENCPGCIGCEDYEPGKKVSPVKSKEVPKNETEKPGSSSGKGLFSLAASTPTFGNTPISSASSPFAGGGLFGMTASGGGDSASTSVFGASAGGFLSAASNTTEGFSFSSLAAKSGSSPSGFKKDESKPFHWSGAGQQLFGAKAEGNDSHDGDEVVQGEDPHFEPVIELPDLVEIKTGEEDYTQVFKHRAKLFRFDKAAQQWKEKGLGEMKILRHNVSGKYRLLLRREQVLKLACNHWLTPELNFQPLQTSETSWCWVAEDYSEDEPKLEQLAVKFKTIDLSKEFKEKIDECQKELLQKSLPTTISVLSDKDATEEVKDSASSEDPVQEGEIPQEEEEDDDEDYEDVEDILLEKRITLYSKDSKDSKDWKVIGLGTLRVNYDEDVNGNKVIVETDKKECVCNHLIARESTLQVFKKKNCEWSPIDFSTDEPVRRHFRAQFSSEAALEEFEKFFTQGRSLAVDSEISESDMMVPREITVPDVYGQAADED